MNIDIKELYELQKGLDQEIAFRHNVSYESTFSKRLLALLVELGEFANETRCFKYWSLKGSSPKEVVLEEYVDGLHFILSLGILLQPRKFIYEIKENKDYNLTDGLLLAYQEALSLYKNYNLEQYEKSLQAYLNLMGYIDMKPHEVINAYKFKLEINYKRQNNKY